MPTFSLTGTLRLVPSWVDAQDVTEVTDRTTSVFTFDLEDGTGTSQANAYWRDVISVAAGATASIDLRALSLSFYGASGSLSLAKVKTLVIVNRSASDSFAVGVSATNRWTAVSSGSLALGPSGILHLTHPGDGYATTATDKVLAITNNGAATAEVEVYVCGVKS